MADLFSDDIEDQAMYTDAMVLHDIRALITAGQREGPTLDYKKDVSDKDNWPEAAAAFANTFGGIIIFGVEAKGDQPRRLTGFDSRGVEIKTRLASTLLSRIQPRPQFQVRVVTLDTDQSKEVALLRVSEGSHPPYMHSKGDEHRVYVRVGAQKAEADYLQLSALLEKRQQAEAGAVLDTDDLIGPQSQLLVTEPANTNTVARNLYRFVLLPNDHRAARRLTVEVERQVSQCIERLYGQPQHDKLIIRRQTTTYFRRGTGTGSEQRFAVTAKGVLGFATHACIKTNDGPFFIPFYFCRDLIDFLTLGASYYGHAQFYGDCVLIITLKIGDEARLFGGVPARNSPNQGSGLFDPPLESIRTDDYTTQTRVSLQPLAAERLQSYLEAVLNDIARAAGSVLSNGFRPATHPLIEDAITRLRS
jgi:hypothetical protein